MIFYYNINNDNNDKKVITIVIILYMYVYMTNTITYEMRRESADFEPLYRVVTVVCSSPQPLQALFGRLGELSALVAAAIGASEARWKTSSAVCHKCGDSRAACIEASKWCKR